jgi:hypothetical protein
MQYCNTHLSNLHDHVAVLSRLSLFAHLPNPPEALEPQLQADNPSNFGVTWRVVHFAWNTGRTVILARSKECNLTFNEANFGHRQLIS